MAFPASRGHLSYPCSPAFECRDCSHSRDPHQAKSRNGGHKQLSQQRTQWEWGTTASSSSSSFPPALGGMQPPRQDPSFSSLTLQTHAAVLLTQPPTAVMAHCFHRGSSTAAAALPAQRQRAIRSSTATRNCRQRFILKIPTGYVRFSDVGKQAAGRWGCVFFFLQDK